LPNARQQLLCWQILTNNPSFLCFGLDCFALVINAAVCYVTLSATFLKETSMKKPFVALLALVSFLTFGAPAHASVASVLDDGYTYSQTDVVGSSAGYGFNSSVTGMTSARYAFSLDSGSFENSVLYVGARNVMASVSTNNPANTLDFGDLILSLAWNDTKTGGSVQVLNLAQNAIYFSVALFGSVTGATTLTSTVSASAVPLPAALPLFGLGIASLAGYASRKKIAKAA